MYFRSLYTGSLIEFGTESGTVWHYATPNYTNSLAKSGTLERVKFKIYLQMDVTQIEGLPYVTGSLTPESFQFQCSPINSEQLLTYMTGIL